VNRTDAQIPVDVYLDFARMTEITLLAITGEDSSNDEVYKPIMPSNFMPRNDGAKILEERWRGQTN
jgi:hypothetical protein